MFFYKYTLIIIIIMKFYEICAERNDEISIIDSGLDIVSPCTVGLQFFADVNNNSTGDLDVEFKPDKCCLDVGFKNDCNILNTIVGCVDSIPQGETKRLKLVAPLIDQFERRGYCSAFIDTRPSDKTHNSMRNQIKINFDTHLTNNDQVMEIPENVKPCNIDEDVLNNCEPVDCSLHYNGQRSFYDNKLKRCTDIPSCVTQNTNDYPDIIYDPNKNKCINDESLTTDDLEYIRDLIHGHDRTQKDVVIIKNKKTSPPDLDFDNDLYNFHSLYMTKDKPEGKKPKEKKAKEKIKVVPKTECAHTQFTTDIHKKVKSFPVGTNKITFTVLGIVVLVQCVLICTMIYFLTKNCCCRKKVIRKYFNYRHNDASVTTPLIATSNIDTETTENPYHSESSYNIDKKIKCYKAIQKEKNAKMSLSDDILSKCLNRRDWRSKPIKSEATKDFTNPTTIKEVTVSNAPKPIFTKKEQNDRQEVETNYRIKVSQTPKPMKPKSEKSTVNFEDEKSKRCDSKKSSKLLKSIAKKLDSKSSKKKERTELGVSDIVLSEKEIKCHSYNYLDSSAFNSMKSMSKKSSEKPVQSIPSQKVGYFTETHSKRDSRSVSTEKSAQASFANDSIDDLLSEHGIMCFDEDNMSKYSFSVNSNTTKSATSDMSSKTSKNNIVKNVWSLLHRKNPSSDPGAKKSKESLDLELIHMSNASVYTSSNVDSECLQTFKRVKESRTSL